MRGWIKQILKESLWAPPAIAVLFSVSMAWLAFALGSHFENRFSLSIEEDSLVTLLSIFATGMLTVSTFTVSAIIAAATGVARNATPRASQFILSDARSQFVLSSFIAAFIYSMVSILALKAADYTSGGRFLLFAGLILIVVLVLVAFVQWVDGVLKLGRQQTVIDKLAGFAEKSAEAEISGLLGAASWDGKAPRSGKAVYPREFGYVSSINVEQLQELAKKAKGEITVTLRPGDFTDPTRPVAYLKTDDEPDDETLTAIRNQIFLFRMQNEETDFRFNLRNLAEMADRALSPAINDPGTAILILDILLSALCKWQSERQKKAYDEVRFEHVFLPSLSASDIFDIAFVPIARDGADMVEVARKLQNVLASIKRLGDKELTRETRRISQIAMDYCSATMVSAAHKKQVGQIADAVQK